ncbi:heavy metal translocating P-type ATPase [Mesorhizobium sp. M0644]|uniref:heavy metal translocating P-type ATPase n=1 Tax=unclassified Mesorhizobium TaxID=325217 RepID=UPI003339D729
MAATKQQTRYRVEGIDCAGCASKIDTAVRRMPGVQDINVSVSAGTLTVTHTPESNLGAIERKVTGLGYAVAPLTSKSGTPASDQSADNHADGRRNHDENVAGLHDNDDAPASELWWDSAKGRLAIASGVALAVAFAIDYAWPATGQWAFIAAMLLGLAPIARRAAMAAAAGIPFTIEMLMTVAAAGAVIIGAGEEAATVVFLFLIGELLEGVAAGNARSSIQALTTLVPKTAFVEKDGQTREVPAESLAVGAIILVRPGDRIPADGEITEGGSAIDESPVSGESVPVRKDVGDTVFAGTINGDGVLRVKVTATAADNTIARVIKLVEEAQENKALTERFIDRFSRWYMPGVVAVAALVAATPPPLLGGDWNEWIYKGLALLLIGCPCALVISVPAAVAASLSAGARRGLLMKGGAVLEGLATINAVALDKTGTLTLGKPQVTDVVAVGASERDILSLAAALEIGSSHPLALAILQRAKAGNIPVPPAAEAKAIGGKGVVGRVGGKNLFLGSPVAAGEINLLPADQAARIVALNDEGKSVAVLLVDNALAGFIAMRDEPRPDAFAGLKALTNAGIRTVMLTGDNKRTAAAIGKQLGIEVRAELLPEDKQRILGELKGQGLRVAKVGDGINDTPALAAADVGIAMGGGTDVALETADAAVLHGRVGDVAAMIRLSQATMANIKQNVTIALGLKAVFLVTTIAGITGLWPAILADTGATVLVTANAMRLLRWKSSW